MIGRAWVRQGHVNLSSSANNFFSSALSLCIFLSCRVRSLWPGWRFFVHLPKAKKHCDLDNHVQIIQINFARGWRKWINHTRLTHVTSSYMSLNASYVAAYPGQPPPLEEPHALSFTQLPAAHLYFLAQTSIVWLIVGRTFLHLELFTPLSKSDTDRTSFP